MEQAVRSDGRRLGGRGGDCPAAHAEPVGRVCLPVAQGEYPRSHSDGVAFTPGFTFFAIPGQWWLGWFLFSSVGIPTSGANWQMLKTGVQQWSWAPFDGLSIGMVSLEFLTGWIVSSVVLGFLCYGLVQLAWGAGHFLRSRKNPGKPSSGKGFGK